MTRTYTVSYTHLDVYKRQVLIGDGELLRQHEGGFLRTDSFQTGNKVNHIPVCLTAETMEAPVNLHAGVFIVMEGADAHPVSSYPDTIMLGSLPGGKIAGNVLL